MERLNEVALSTRRELLRSVVPVAGSALVAPLAFGEEKKKQAGGDEDVSTNEDLMREHGILKRVLLAYEEIIRRLRFGGDYDPQTVKDGATIIRRFIEDYHEKLEEDHLFPRFRKAGILTELVDVLLAQHKAGRRLTDQIRDGATAKTRDERESLVADLVAFNRMYAPHEAREDTVLFPELHKIVSKSEYDAMGEQFERIERQTFGGDGFDIYQDKVTELEKRLGIYDLAQFTPNMQRD
jgi:hemerythrin-like domain-containing protein